MSVRSSDNVYQRRKYKDDQFGDKRSTRDAYTGNRIFYGNPKGAKYKHSTTKTTDIDHITPIEVIERRYPNLTQAQQKELANLTVRRPKITKNGYEVKTEYVNYATTNAHLNRSKGGQTNAQYLIREFRKGEQEFGELANQAVRMIPAQVKSEACIATVAAGMELHNALSSVEIQQLHAAGFDAAARTALFAGTASAVKNLYAVATQEKSLKEATADTLKTTSKAAVGAYIHSAVMHQIGKVVPGNIDVMVTGIVEISNVLGAYANGQIAEGELLQTLAENTAYLVAAKVGQTAGAMIGNALLPGVGGVIGGMVGEFITTSVCMEVVDSLKFYQKAEKENSRICALCTHAELEIHASQVRLREIIQLECYELIETTDEGFTMIATAIERDDMNMLKGGFLKIGSKFGLTEEYLSEGEVTLDNLFVGRNEVVTFY